MKSPHQRNYAASLSPKRSYYDNPRRRKSFKLKQVQYFLFFGLTFVTAGLTYYSSISMDDGMNQDVADIVANVDTDTDSKNNPYFEHYSSQSSFDDVLYFDEAAMKNVRATYEGARSWLKWAASTILEVTVADKLDTFQAIPLLATVDRRPLTARKQMEKADGLHDNGNLLGCALTSTTFLSNLENMYAQSYKDFPTQCDVCIQFSNREDMHGFLPGVGYEQISDYQESTATKCFGGVASNSARFMKWQKQDSRFEGFGYPITVDCALPNGIRELTCREITKLHNRMEVTDGVQAIYLQTKFSLDGYFGDVYPKTFHAFSRWPWAAVQSHDDDRSKIGSSLPETWDDTASKFVPNSVRDMKFLHVEGPGYAMGEYNGSITLKSVQNDPDSKGGIHFRLVVNLFHLIRNSPQSTHMMAIVDGQARTTHRAMQALLSTKLEDVFHSYSNVFTEGYLKNTSKLISKYSMKGKLNQDTKPSEMTLAELLHLRGIKIHIVPITTPSLTFEKSVCGGQYTFAAYLAARFAADYHVIMYVDGDTAMIEGSERSLPEILYDRFFSKNSSKCAGHRIRLIEQYVKPEDDRVERVLQCSEEASLNKAKWDYANANCHLKEGHIVARTDSIWAMSVHHPDTDIDFVPEGIEDCISPGNKENDRYFLKADEFVQLHLRNRIRKDECVCFGNNI